MSFSDQLLRLRRKKKISQKTLAEMVGVSQSAIYQWEKGSRKPKAEQLSKIADVLGVSIDELILDDHSDPVFSAAKVANIIRKNKENEIIFDASKIIETLDKISIEKIVKDTIENEETLLSAYHSLNNLGKEEALKRVSELTEIKKYTEKEKKKIQAVYKPKE